ncbi:cytochrome c-type biogenesis protein CcmH precursor [mine drainage metagenome]|uniref:Cytochrome c-type biogenesis protein CcmH n=1 Tax=mine drainage metagenome TaxID=410659 RepID=A0A1J5Q6W3_9ZZZZ
MKILIALILALAAALPTVAGEAKPLATNEAAEQHMLALTRNLRCLVCQDESLAASQATLARDLRAQVLQMVERGESDKQITDYLVERYGNYVRFRPPFVAETWALWLGPFALLALGLAVLVMIIRRRAQSTDTPLDSAQLDRARALLAQNGDME